MESKAIVLQLSFTTLPQKFIVRHLDREVWIENAPSPEAEREISMHVPEQGVDLYFRVEWLEDGPLSAARVRFTEIGGETSEKTIWGRGVTEEVLTFP